jgi:hypothetical protein
VIGSLGGIAAMIAAITGAVLMLVLTYVLGIALFHFGTILATLSRRIDDAANEIIPMLSEATTTVRNVNRELDTVHGITESVGKVAKSAEHVSKAVDQAVSSPLIKIAAAGYGFSRASKKVRK